MKSAILSALVAVFTIGCASVGRLNLDVAAPSQAETIFVIGANNSHMKIDVFPGEIINGKFKMSQFRPAAIATVPTDGYIIGRCRGNDVLAITQVSLVEDEHTILGTPFVPYDEEKTLVFKAAPGRVIYLGDLSYSLKDGKINYEYENIFNLAKIYMDMTYKNLAGRLEYQAPEFLPTTNTLHSGKSSPVMLYVPMPMHR